MFLSKGEFIQLCHTNVFMHINFQWGQLLQPVHMCWILYFIAFILLFASIYSNVFQSRFTRKYTKTFCVNITSVLFSSKVNYWYVRVGEECSKYDTSISYPPSFYVLHKFEAFSFSFWELVKLRILVCVVF